jgi:signal transduction histidine kinase
MPEVSYDEFFRGVENNDEFLTYDEGTGKLTTLSRDYLLGPSNWISNKAWRRLAENTIAILNDEDAIFKAGKNIFRTAASFRHILMRFVGGQTIINRVPKENAKYNKNKKIEIIENLPNHAIVRLHWGKDPSLNRYFCDMNRGVYEGLGELTGNLGHVREASCQFKGDAYCEFHIAWKPKPFLRRISDFVRLGLARDIIEDLENKIAEINEIRLNQDRLITLKTQELQEAHRKIIEQERLIIESHIAGGMAHEIRNALGAAKLRLDSLSSTGKLKENQDKLMVLLEMVKEQPGLSENALRGVVQAIRVLYDNQKLFEKTFQEVGISTERGLQITNRVMDYSRLHMDKADETVDLNAIFSELESTYKDSLYQKGIALQIELPEGLVVKGSNSRLHSVFQNLLLNARDAVIEKGHPTGTIAVQGKIIDEMATIEIADTGMGIPSENLDKIFYPFFSTKPSTGMGLGLSECQKIVNQHGGTIGVESTLGKGTLFRIAFPACKV